MNRESLSINGWNFVLSSQVFDIIQDDSTYVEKLAQNVSQFTEGMTKAGFTVGGDPSHPICPIHLGDARLAVEFADTILEKGIFVIGFSYPVVGGCSLVQISYRLFNSQCDISRLTGTIRESAHPNPDFSCTY